MKAKTIKTILRLTASIIVVAFVLSFLTLLLKPKFMTGITEGAMIAEFYKEEMCHDVVFVGDCELYENISPITLWENYGISSYIRGSAQQLIWQSYYLMEDTLRYETPQVFVFNVLSMKYAEPQKETYNRMTIDGMRWSMSKVNSIKASMTEDEHFIDYVFPILRFHSRWSELTNEDLEYLFTKDKVAHNGYYMRVDTLPVTSIPEARPLADYALSTNCWDYLNKMLSLCRKNNIELVLVKAPSLFPIWYDEWEQQIEAYASKNNLKYYNLLEDSDIIGINWSTDTYDGGLHLNLSGATKNSIYLGKLLQEECGVSDHRGDPYYESIWSSKIDFYYASIEEQKIKYGITDSKDDE
ncbi:MAG: SGNH/GDSL hydrolase family protein [Clostridia bacterium]|nr:SGNH/GDSL hydrolase family protein [Clostridia bacterium]